MGCYNSCSSVRSLLLLVCLVQSALGWWDTGHMLVAQVAYNILSAEQTPDVQKALTNSLDSLQTFYTSSSSFVTAACWMDDVKSRNLYHFSNWHFINLPVCDDSYTDVCSSTSASNEVAKGDNIVWAIQDTITTLKSPYAGGFERGFALKLLLHLVGDLHQPLHAVARFSSDTPTGDAGGNLFKVNFIGGITNLHSMWDSGVGLFNNSISRPLTDESKMYIEQWAATIQGKINTNTIAPGFNITAWAVESVALSQQYVYAGIPFKGTPSQDYINAAQPIVIQQIGVAGYRLAQLLQQIALCDTKTNNCPTIDVPVPPEPSTSAQDPIATSIDRTVIIVVAILFALLL